MAGPVVSIGTPGTASYRVDYAPLIQDRALALQGMRDLFGGIKQFADRRNTASLAEMFAAKADHDDLVSFASKRGLLPELGAMLTTRKALAPERRDPLSPLGKLRADRDAAAAAGQDVTGYDARIAELTKPKDTRTDETRRVAEWLERNPGKGEADYWKMKRGPGTTLNVSNLSEYRKRYGSNPPTNHIWTGREIPDAEGRMIPELVPIGEAARKIEAGAAKTAAAGEAQQRTAGLVTKHADRIRSLVRDSFLPVTGPGGSALANIPGTGAHNAAKLLDSIKAIASFDTLQKMRAASPTGGALGSVSNVELGFLQSAIASLEQSQSEAQFLENLALVENAFRAVIHGPNAPGNGAGGAPAPRNYMSGGGVAAVMQSLGLGGPTIPRAPDALPEIPATGNPATAATIDPRYMGGVGTVSGPAPDYLRVSDADLAAINPATPQERDALLAEINRRLAAAGARP